MAANWAASTKPIAPIFPTIIGIDPIGRDWDIVWLFPRAVVSNPFVVRLQAKVSHESACLFEGLVIDLLRIRSEPIIPPNPTRIGVNYSSIGRDIIWLFP